ncbi:MAG TPA: Flp pilus assembly protein CpaB [Dehalococcoidia bacterium]|jgi:pilus assembly protein CpaB|nr:Flp pilus assembly protein CpaB [Dehalococcoidia bacterium]
MTTIAANAGPERTTKWLLLGGVALALITGVIVFLALANVGGNDNGSTSASGATGEVLVAKDNIAAGTRLNADMFRVATFAEGDLVPEAVSDPQAIVGQTATTDIQRGQQLSRVHVAAATDDKRADQLAFKIPDGQRAVAVKVDETSAIGGLLVPGDRVDVLVTIKEKDENRPDQDFLHVQTVLQNVLVVAREQTEVQRVVALGTPAAGAADGRNTPDDQAFEQRPDDIKPDPGLSTVSLALSPQDVQQLVLADALGDITLALRPYGESAPAQVTDLRVPVSVR